MPERDRFIIAAFAALVAVILVVGLGHVFSYSQSQREHREAATSYEVFNHDHYADCAKRNTEFERIACLLEQLAADQEQARGRADLNAQQDMATWAVAMLWVSAIGILISVAGIVVIYGTLSETRAMTIATREIGQNQSRAFISFGRIDWRRKANEIISMPIKNTGVTPARGVKYNFKVFLGVEASPDGLMGLGPIPETLAASYDLGQGEAGSIAYFDSGDPVERAFDSMIEAGQPCRLIVIVRYADVFDRYFETKHDTKFVQSPKGSGEISRWDPTTTERQIDKAEFLKPFQPILA